MSNPTYKSQLLTFIDRYLELGWKLLPIDWDAKRPYTNHGFYDATSDKKKLLEWLEMWPNMAIGVPTGLVSGFFSLDIDPRNGGQKTFAELIEQNGELPLTPTFRSGGGGTQMLFSYPKHKLPSRVGLLPGIDIKSDGGYIVVPPSWHKNQSPYLWVPERIPGKTPFAQAPEWLIDKILESNRPGWDGKREAVCADDLCFPEGTRENSLVSLIGTMNRRGMTRPAILAAMQAENLTKCKPPLDQSEVEHIVDKQLSQYKPDPDFVVGVVNGRDPAGWPTRSALAGVASPDAGRVEEIVASVLGKGTVTILAATWKSGKTLLTYRLLLDAIRGNPAFGIFHVPKPLKVMVLQFEMPLPEDERRFRRLALGSSLDPQGVVEFSEMGRLCHYSRPQIDLTSARDIKNFHTAVFTGGYDLIVIDSVMAAFAGIDMNDNSRVRKLFADALLPLTTNGVSILLLHHRRKEAQRKKGDPLDDPKSALLGAQAWGAAADRILSLVPLDDDKKSPDSFKIKLSFVGGWAPNGLDKVGFHIFDDGDGTCIEAISSDAIKALSKVEQAAKDIWRFVSDRKEARWTEVQANLKDSYTRNELAKGRDTGASRGWYAYLPRPTATSPLVLVSSTPN